MFTGLVEDIGTLIDVRPRGNGKILSIRTAIPMAEVRLGDSISVNGACLTADGFHDDGFECVAATETLAKTTLGQLRKGDALHLERALKLGDRLDGHLVQGHVDGTGAVVSAGMQSESFVLWVRPEPGLLKYIAAKGSITIDGVSLTVNEVGSDAFRVNLVPHTTDVTLLGALRTGTPVNLEVDVLAKYVERLLGDRGAGGGLTIEALRDNGWS